MTVSLGAVLKFPDLDLRIVRTSLAVVILGRVVGRLGWPCQIHE